MNIAISKEESNAISIVRVLAMLSIVICHFFQAYDNWLAFRFNIGVQIFFVLSGYLYGHKEVDKWIPWFIGRFKKLYIPCFLYCLIATTILILTTNQSFSIFSIKNYIAISAINGIDHLWFMKAIFLCYLTTPILQFFRKYPLVVYIGLIILGIVEFGFLHIQQDKFSWIWLYAIGYFFPLLKEEYKNILYVLFIISVLTISAIMMFGDCNREIVELWHYIGGVALCILPIVLLKKYITTKDNHCINTLDSYSFYIYITHHIYLVGPLSFTAFIPNKILLILIVTLLIILSSIILKKISDYIIKLL